MKTSKEMQLKIIDKMRENIESGKCAFDSIQYEDEDDGLGFVDEDMFTLQFNEYEYRIKPQTITINGVEIPKPLDKDEIVKIGVGRMNRVYSVSHKGALCGVLTPETALAYGYSFVYRTEAEAIEASRLLFGIEC